MPEVDAIEQVRMMVADVTRQVEQLPNASLRRMAPVIGRARAELEKGLTEWLRTATDAAERFTAQKMRIALRQLRAAEAAIREIAPNLASTLKMGGTEAAMLSNRMLTREIVAMSKVFNTEHLGMGVLNLRVASQVVDDNAWILARTNKLSRRYSTKAISTIRSKLGVGVLKEETVGQMTHRIVSHMPEASGRMAAVSKVRRWMKSPVGTPAPDGLASDMAGGLLRGPYASAERLIRTELANAYGAYHQDSIREFASTQAVGGEKVWKRWDASSDRHCVLCADLDGVTVEVDKPFPSGHMHEPRHPNCRCSVSPWMDSWPEVKPLPPRDDGVARRFAVPERPVVTKSGMAQDTSLI